MTFLVERTYYNGYRCCCYNEWHAAVTVDDLSSVKLPTTVDDTCMGADSYLSSLEVTDQSTDTVVYVGHLTYPTGHRTRGMGYMASRWAGVHNGVHFESIKTDLPNPSATWEGALAAIQALDEERERQRLERQLASAQAELDKLSSNR